MWDACVAAIRDGGDDLWGVAVNVAPTACGESDAREVLRRAIASAERTGRPLLVGTRHADDWPLEDLLNWLRPGDEVTYCLHSLSERVVREGRVLDSVWRWGVRCPIRACSYSILIWRRPPWERASWRM